MGFVIHRVEVLAVPAHREVNLSTDTTRARHRGQRIIPGGRSVEIQAQVGDSLLSVAAGVVRPERWITRNHAEVIGERLYRVGLAIFRIIEEIVNDIPDSQG
jgi:hypothetical protein